MRRRGRQDDGSCGCPLTSALSFARLVGSAILRLTAAIVAAAVAPDVDVELLNSNILLSQPFAKRGQAVEQQVARRRGFGLKLRRKHPVLNG